MSESESSSAASAPVFSSPSDDKEMEQASQKARHSFRFFWREMSWERRRIVPALELAAVKGTFRDPPELKSDDPDALEVEHMWLIDVDFDGREVEGTLINSPISLKSVKEGDRVTIRGKQICDWMYVLDGEVYGGFTVDLLRSRMGKAERKQHDNAWGYDFGEVGIINLVPPTYIGDDAPAKKGLFGFGKPKVTQQDYTKVAAAEHPMSINMRSSLSDTIDENPEMKSQADDHGYTFLHQLALAGSYDGVDVCLQKGFDPSQEAPNGMTAYTLAKSLGWKKVMQRLEQDGAA
ncbi:DUF2314 domain-containing protein [Stieleria sp. JC731]|uniref:DUF2314 domain-containing protein n=1 Tax=Pirellulaceae TaxID=2691357 RepID=UPI001E576112|nr:DUF2314 domain-containing protein [Stieleria sp. JC731]MCC9603611.1 DUF2314 domain-containing protein [Stieleria sp. JC731]